MPKLRDRKPTPCSDLLHQQQHTVIADAPQQASDAHPQQVALARQAQRLAGEGEMCLDVITPGYLVILQAQERLYIYHTDKTGDIYRLERVEE
jgi:hypothetical protein